jgi:hypothetical protein
MDREDVIRMAREAGLCVGTNLSGVVLVGAPAEIGLAHLTIEELERFAALVAAVEREKSLKLWMLLDDVDTADDIAKADDKLYRSICQKYQKRRWEILSEQEVDTAIRARGQA